MRQVLEMLVDLAAEYHKEQVADPEARNQKTNEVRGAYEVLDDSMSNPRKYRNDRRVAEAMTAADFPLYFGQAISRAFYGDYPMKVGSWTEWTAADETPDFRDVERGRTSEFGNLVKRAELGEAKEEALTESWIQYGVEEYAKAFSLSWRLLVNDDMGEIRRFPQKLLRAAIRFENQFVNGLYDNATTKAALAALGTDYSDTVTLDVDGLKSAYEKFLNRTTAEGHPLDVSPTYLVTNPVHELTVREILAGMDVDKTADSAVVAYNRVTQGLLQWRADPYISTTTDWYLLANPADINAITVARLRGYETPQVYLRAPDLVPFSGGSIGTPSWLMGDFTHGEITFQILDIIGGWDDATYVGVTDYQGIFHGHA